MNSKRCPIKSGQKIWTNTLQKKIGQGQNSMKRSSMLLVAREMLIKTTMSDRPLGAHSPEWLKLTRLTVASINKHGEQLHTLPERILNDALRETAILLKVMYVFPVGSSNFTTGVQGWKFQALNQVSFFPATGLLSWSCLGSQPTVVALEQMICITPFTQEIPKVLRRSVPGMSVEDQIRISYYISILYLGVHYINVCNICKDDMS